MSGDHSQPEGTTIFEGLYLSRYGWSPVNTIFEIFSERHRLWHLRMSPDLSGPELVLVYFNNSKWSSNFCINLF